MKCPACEKWNRAGLPHCIYCGTELPDDAYGINGIPQIILFGPDGTILKRNLRGAAIEDAVQEALK